MIDIKQKFQENFKQNQQSKNNLFIAKLIKIIDIVKRLIGMSLAIYLLYRVVDARGDYKDGVYENDCWASYGDIVPRKKVANPQNNNKPELTKDGIKFYLDDINAEIYFTNVTRKLQYFIIPYLIFILVVFVDEILSFLFKGNKGYLRHMKKVGFYSNILFIMTVLILMIYRYRFKV